MQQRRPLEELHIPDVDATDPVIEGCNGNLRFRSVHTLVWFPCGKTRFLLSLIKQHIEMMKGLWFRFAQAQPGQLLSHIPRKVEPHRLH